MGDSSGGRRLAVDAVTALRIIRDDPGIDQRYRLVGPAVLRSDVLSLLYREVRGGVLSDKDARAQLDGLATLKIRLLGDRVSRATAWKLARQRDGEDVSAAEYVAVAVLQADALVAGDAAIAAMAEGLVDLADYGDLRR
jgi:predicted nucleic acid-binding protein